MANLSHCTPQAIEALRLALRYQDDLAVLGSVGAALELHEGLSVGAVCTIYHVARQLGFDKALGSTFAGKLALWQVMARVLDQGSRLSAVRLAQTHAACALLGCTRGLDAAVALREVQTKLARWHVEEWLRGEAEGRTLRLRLDETVRTYTDPRERSRT